MQALEINHIIIIVYTLTILSLCVPCTCVQVVVIKKSASAKLGLSIKGGTKSTKGNPLDPNDNGIFVSKVSSEDVSRI